LADDSKKMKVWRVPKIQGSILKCGVPPLWLTYISERRTTFAKAYPIQVGAMENMLGNTLETWGTYWEPIENLKRT
jgi:hypothetical protein